MKPIAPHRLGLLQPNPQQHGRRELVAAGLLWAVTLRPVHAQALGSGTPSSALLADDLRQLIRRWSGEVLPRVGRVELDIAPLVENGNAVPITVRVDSPMSAADHVREIVVFNERNPQRDVLRCTLTPGSGRAEVSARIRLATTQHLVALARMSDGSVWQHTVEVIVTLAACLE